MLSLRTCPSIVLKIVEIVHDVWYVRRIRGCSSRGSSEYVLVKLDAFERSIVDSEECHARLDGAFERCEWYLWCAHTSSECAVRSFIHRIHTRTLEHNEHKQVRNQIGALLMIPSELLRICVALVNDPEREFYDPYRGVDSNVWGYNALIDILDDVKKTKRREIPDGVFCRDVRRHGQWCLESRSGHVVECEWGD